MAIAPISYRETLEFVFAEETRARRHIEKPTPEDLAKLPNLNENNWQFAWKSLALVAVIPVAIFALAVSSTIAIISYSYPIKTSIDPGLLPEVSIRQSLDPE